MSKKRKSGLFVLAESIGTAIIAIAMTPLYAIDAMISS